MKALLIIMWAGGHGWNMTTVWFSTMEACEKAKPAIVKNADRVLGAHWYSNASTIECVGVDQ